LAQLNNSKIDIFSADFGDEVLCVGVSESISTPGAVLAAGVSTSHVCQTALIAGYNALW